jgi:hypothetical protein
MRHPKAPVLARYVIADFVSPWCSAAIAADGQTLPLGSMTAFA